MGLAGVVLFVLPSSFPSNHHFIKRHILEWIKNSLVFLNKLINKHFNFIYSIFSSAEQHGLKESFKTFLFEHLLAPKIFVIAFAGPVISHSWFLSIPMTISLVKNLYISCIVMCSKSKNKDLCLAGLSSDILKFYLSFIL